MRGDYATDYPPWACKMKALFEQKRTIKSDIEHLKRDAIALRLAIADAKLSLADKESKIGEHRKVRPIR